MLVFSAEMGMMLVPLALMALSDVRPAESGAASDPLNSTQRVGGSPGLSILVTVFGTASRNEVDQQTPAFLARADPAEKALFARTGRLPPARGNQIVTSDVSAGFIGARRLRLVVLFAIPVHPSEIERLKGGGMMPGG